MSFQEISDKVGWVVSYFSALLGFGGGGIMQLASKGQECIRGRQTHRPIPILDSQEGLGRQPMP